MKRLREGNLITAELLLKKRGRPLLLGKNLDDHVQEYIFKLCKHGCVITTEVAS